MKNGLKFLAVVLIALGAISMLDARRGGGGGYHRGGYGGHRGYGHRGWGGRGYYGGRGWYGYGPAVGFGIGVSSAPSVDYSDPGYPYFEYQKVIQKSGEAFNRYAYRRWLQANYDDWKNWWKRYLRYSGDSGSSSSVQFGVGVGTGYGYGRPYYRGGYRRW